MTRAPSDLAGLLGSRICHDLISPIGAISNGIELLSMAGGPPGPEIDLIAQSAQGAAARIAFFRVAFGAAAPGQTIAAAGIRKLLADTGRGGRAAIDWQPAGDLPRAEVRLAFLLLDCLESALPLGGKISVTRSDAGDWRLRAAANRPRELPAAWATLGGAADTAGLGPAEVQFVLAPLVAAELGRRIDAASHEGALEIAF